MLSLVLGSGTTCRAADDESQALQRLMAAEKARSVGTFLDKQRARLDALAATYVVTLTFLRDGNPFDTDTNTTALQRCMDDDLKLCRLCATTIAGEGRCVERRVFRDARLDELLREAFRIVRSASFYASEPCFVPSIRASVIVLAAPVLVSPGAKLPRPVEPNWILTPTPPPAKLSAPRELSADVQRDRILLSWGGVEGAAQYLVEYWSPGSPAGQSQKAEVSRTFMWLEGMPDGNYRFRVTAIGVDGSRSPSSDSMPLQVRRDLLPVKPEGSVAGIVFAVVSLDDIANLAATADLSVLVLDRHHRLVACSDRAREPGEDLTGHPLVLASRSAGTVATSELTYKLAGAGNQLSEVSGFAAPVPGDWGWMVILERRSR